MAALGLGVQVVDAVGPEIYRRVVVARIDSVDGQHHLDDVTATHAFWDTELEEQFRGRGFDNAYLSLDNAFGDAGQDEFRGDQEGQLALHDHLVGVLVVGDQLQWLVLGIIDHIEYVIRVPHALDLDLDLLLKPLNL